jgi:hypothetical protein
LTFALGLPQSEEEGPFNLVIDGKGTVWIDDVGLTLRPPSANRGG